MKICKVVEDLWPLYTDGDLSEESKQFVEEHLAACMGCNQKFTEDQPSEAYSMLQSSDNVPGSPEKFLLRLKRRIQAIVISIIFLILLVSGTTWYYGKWSVEQAFKKQLAAEQQFFKEQLATLEEISPPSEELLEQAGITFEGPKARADKDQLLVQYGFRIQKDSSVQWVEEDMHWFNEEFLVDASTGSPLPVSGGRGSGTNEGLSKEVRVRPLKIPPETVMLKTKTIYAQMEPEKPGFAYKFYYKGGPETINIDRDFIHQGIRFNIDSLELNEDRFVVNYRQLTPVSEKGVYQLQFSFDDRMGNLWSGEPTKVIDANNPKQYDIKAPVSISENWILKVNGVTLVIPGIKTEIEVGEDGSD